MRRSEPAGAGPPVPAEVIPQLAAAVARIAAAHEEPAPATVPVCIQAAGLYVL
jgi:hypothetical protein